MRRDGDVFGRRGNRQLKTTLGTSWIIRMIICCTHCSFDLLDLSFHYFQDFELDKFDHNHKPISVDEQWETAASGGGRPSSAPRADMPPPPVETNGYLRVRCNGGLNQQRTAVRSPRDALVNWYKTVALEAMKEHGAIYLTPFSHRLLRCRVNYHALQFKPQIMKVSQAIVSKLQTENIKGYMEENFAPKELIYNERRAIGKCPNFFLQVGLILRAMGFDNSTCIYLATGEFFGGDRFMKPFRALFPHLSNHNTMGLSADELAEGTRGMSGSTVDYMVCLLSDIFFPTYDGPSNFANNVMGHRLYYGFQTIIHPDRKDSAPIFIKREKGQTTGSE
ncbi:hypothetical protein MKW98_022332 [Papaver atlanticum]|uniref:O-fucosyltransferase family protein n=1 Tax=Papaver atlanticum TaxID=357466 RepID=A0AAD4XS52_9MAGN|nr:hypothetical protein MKW98_022332 [Papaver atlanticum]